MRYKLFVHILAIGLLTCGLILIHIAYNYISDHFEPYSPIHLFSLELRPGTVLDTGIICIFIGFSLEFLITFRPIEVIKK